MSKFVAGADICFKNGEKFATDHFGLFEDIDSAVRAQKKLHPSFGYSIYVVDDSITKNLKRSFGLRSGTPCSGYKVLSGPIFAFDHPAWISDGQT